MVIKISKQSLSQDLDGKSDEYVKEIIEASKIENGSLVIEFDTFARIRLKHSPHGLGDLVAKGAKPIARLIDSVFGTDIENCAGCMNRQAVLNEVVSMNSKSHC